MHATKGPVAAIVALTLVGCGRIAFEPALDADVSLDPDASLGTGMFDPPMIGLSLPMPSDDPWLRADGLEVYFTAPVNAGMPSDIWSASRTSTTDAWSAIAINAELSTGGEDARPVLSRDGLTLWFATDAVGTIGGDDIYVATRASLSSAWAAPIHVTELATTGDEVPGSVFDGGRAMMLFSNRGATNNKLWLARRPTEAAAWEAPTLVAELDRPEPLRAPFVSEDGLRIYFASEATGDRDLYFANRASVTEPFGVPVPLTELDSSATEDDPTLSPDERTILFSSNRTGTRAIYVANRGR